MQPRPNTWTTFVTKKRLLGRGCTYKYIICAFKNASKTHVNTRFGRVFQARL